MSGGDQLSIPLTGTALCWLFFYVYRMAAPRYGKESDCGISSREMAGKGLYPWNSRCVLQRAVYFLSDILYPSSIPSLVLMSDIYYYTGTLVGVRDTVALPSMFSGEPLFQHDIRQPDCRSPCPGPGRPVKAHPRDQWFQAGYHSCGALDICRSWCISRAWWASRWPWGAFCL